MLLEDEPAIIKDNLSYFTFAYLFHTFKRTVTNHKKLRSNLYIVI
jgi:hypothetical protein